MATTQSVKNLLRTSNPPIPPADTHGMPTSEERLMKAIWGKPQLIYDRRQAPPRRTSWRGGRRASDWPTEFARTEKMAKRFRQTYPKLLM
jgi:hypothetical protein